MGVHTLTRFPCNQQIPPPTQPGALDHCFDHLPRTLPNPRTPNFKQLRASTRDACEHAALADPLCSGFSMLAPSGQYHCNLIVVLWHASLSA